MSSSGSEVDEAEVERILEERRKEREQREREELMIEQAKLEVQAETQNLTKEEIDQILNKQVKTIDI